LESDCRCLRPAPDDSVEGDDDLVGRAGRRRHGEGLLGRSNGKVSLTMTGNFSQFSAISLVTWKISSAPSRATSPPRP
jgi:hypothetical protein